MSGRSLQVSRAVSGRARGPLVWRWSAAACLVAAAVSLAPGWWGHVASSAARHVGRFWPAVVLVLVAGALVVGGRGCSSVWSRSSR
ncbi:hypothetical protein AB0G02_36165 [Actinosynnema sp. NPDC023658]|uniref:hypothetical protein n=1 Tax=Actinosynnema sp. NPDC023658 TaxID=3155465 RepID=UPI0033CD8D90